MARSEKVQTTASNNAAGRGARGGRLAQLRSTAKGGCAVPGDVGHGGAQVDPGQPHRLRIEGQVEAGADGDLEGVSAGSLHTQSRLSLNKVLSKNRICLS
jgi:hypothetical protein